MKYCPMKFASLANPRIINPDKIDEFLECNTTNCAWYCTYPNGEGECAIHSISALYNLGNIILQFKAEPIDNSPET